MISYLILSYKMSKIESYFSRILEDGPPRVEDLDPEDELRLAGEAIVPIFDAGVAYLMDNKTFPNPEINQLMLLFARLVSNEVTPTGVTDAVPTLGFFCEKLRLDEKALVLIPIDFVEQFRENPIRQLGALVYIASQARDFYNGRYYDRRQMKHRAYAFEAEFVLTMQLIDPEFVPDEYQRQIIGHLPLGLRSLPPALSYESMPYPPPAPTVA